MSSTSRNTISGAASRGPLRALALAAVLLSVPAAALAQNDAVPRRLDRKINVMEKVLNEVLRESPYWLVGGGSDYTRSVYLDEFGVVFSFDASLVNHDGDGIINLEGLSFLEDLKNIRVEQDGDKWVVFKDYDKDEDKDKDSDADSGDVESLTLDELREKRRAREAGRYEEGKEELIDTLLDYGDTLTELRNEQFIAIIAYLENIDLLEEDDITHLIIKAKVSDLRAYAEDKLTRAQLLERISAQEY